MANIISDIIFVIARYIHGDKAVTEETPNVFNYYAFILSAAVCCFKKVTSLQLKDDLQSFENVLSPVRLCTVTRRGSIR